MIFVYPAIFKQETGGYSVSFPDLKGCFTEGDTLEEAMANAEEAMSLYLEPVDDNPVFPDASSIRDIKVDSDEFVTLVSAQVEVNVNRSIRKNLTIPSWLNTRAEAAGINFSQTLQDALRRKLG